jgi:uncharacterized membrane protein YhdT
VESTTSKGPKKRLSLGFVLILWIATAWLLYPLVTADTADMGNVKEYICRSALGITLMVILFGKTLIDLIFPLVSSQKMPLLNTIFLTIYSLALGGGIIYMIAKMISLYLKSQQAGFIF